MRRLALLLIVASLLAPAVTAQYVNTSATGFPPVTYAQLVALGPIANGRARYCSDCTKTDTCAAGGTGAIAVRLDAGWSCRAGAAAAFPASATSAQLAASLTDETGGSGVAVFSGSPTIVTPTIASFTNATHNHTNAAGGGTLTDAALSAAVTAAKGGTGIDTSASTGVPRVSAGTWTTNAGLSHLAASSSANLAGVLTDETGTGVAVFGTSPTLSGNLALAGSSTFTVDDSAASIIDVYNQNTSGGTTLRLYNQRTDASNYTQGSLGWYPNFRLSTLKAGTGTAVPLELATESVVAVSISSTQNVTFSGQIIPSQTIGIVGTTTNNNANAGAVGQFMTAVCPGPATTATITVTIASPAVVTWTAHPFSGTAPRFDACPVVFTTTGALPTGITASTNYWVIPTTISGNTFSIATSVANAIAATAVNTSGSQSGTQTGTAGTVLSTGATKDVTGLALTAGDWDCSGATDFQFGATTSYTNLTGSISTTAATLGGQDTGFDYETPAAVPTAGADMTWRISDVRQLLSGTTNVFLVAQGTFTLSTLKAYGTIRCRRMR